MKAQDVKALHEKSMEELKKMLGEARSAKNNAALELAQMKAKNTKVLASARREVAQLLTIIKEKEIKNGKNA
jgi:ribosomal protein L29